MSKSRCLCAWAFLLTLWTFLGVRVGQDYVPETAFDRYKRFDFLETPLGEAELSDLSNPFLIKRIRRAIETTLGQRGYERSFKGTPDFWIASIG